MVGKKYEKNLAIAFCSIAVFFLVWGSFFLCDTTVALSDLGETTKTGVQEEQQKIEDDEKEQKIEEEQKPPFEAIVISPQEWIDVDNTFFESSLFLGDSLTEGLILYETLDSAHVIATLGMTVEKAKAHVEKIKEISPKRLFVMLGINDLANFNQSSESRALNYVNFLNTLKLELPETKIYAQELLPIAEKYNNTKNQITNDKINSFNSTLRMEEKEDGVFVIETNRSFVGENDFLHNEVTSDGMHIKRAYYGWWMDVIKQNVVALEEYYAK